MYIRKGHFKDVEAIVIDLLDSKTDKIVDSYSALHLRPMILTSNEHDVAIRWHYDNAQHE